MKDQILATVTDEEAEQIKACKAEAKKVLKFYEDAGALTKEAMDKIKGTSKKWFDDMRGKYGIVGDDLTFDPDTNTIREQEKDNLGALMGLLAGLKCLMPSEEIESEGK